jgi:hypothetical protein
VSKSTAHTAPQRNGSAKRIAADAGHGEAKDGCFANAHGFCGSKLFLVPWDPSSIKRLLNVFITREFQGRLLRSIVTLFGMCALLDRESFVRGAVMEELFQAGSLNTFKFGVPPGLRYQICISVNVSR